MNPTTQALLSELSASVEGLDARQTQLRPATHADKWTIQQVIEHLLLSYRSTQEIIQSRIDKGTPTKASPGATQRLQQFAVTRCGYFPTGRAAPALVTPAADLVPASGRELGDTLATELHRFDDLCTRASALFGESRFASHAILGPLSPAQWRNFHLIHGRHHIRQVKAIRQEHGL